MKTVIDAVNELKGDINNAIIDEDRRESFASIILCVDSYSDYLSGKCYSFGDEDGEDLISSWQFICTVGEFNACVDELSAAAWINGISLEEWKAGMKNTVIDSHGNELEIGKIYEFSDDGVKWFSGTFSEFSQNHKRKYVDDTQSHWEFIRECQSPLGTIKKAPVKLVDGKAYQFYLNGTKKVGVWHDDIGSFFDGFDGPISEICTRSEATRIIPLAPETK